jgi:aminoglycoside phosphotransferase (APT) family kinase protein
MLMPLLREPAALAQALLPWLEERLSGARIELGTVTQADGGGSSETYFLHATISDAEGARRESWVLRVQATSHQIYQDPAVERQFRVMKQLATASAAPVPTVRWYEPDASVIGAPFYLMDNVDGEVPSALYHSDPWLAGLSPSRRHALWLSAIEAMAAVHRAPVSQFGFLAFGMAESGLEQELDRWDSYAAWTGLTLHPIQLRVRDALGRDRPRGETAGLAWGDARLSNMIFRSDRCAAVIDFETASLGGAETDLGWWLFYDWMVSEGSGTPRLEGFGDRQDLLATWVSFAGRPARDMAWHELFATWRYSLVSDRARQLAAAHDPSIANRPSLSAQRLEVLLAA